MDLGKKISAFIVFLKPVNGPIIHSSSQWEIWDLPWILLHHYDFFSYQSGYSLKFISKYSLFSSSLLPLLWLKSSLFLACLDQQPYNLKIYSRCCQCPAAFLDTHYSQFCHRLVKASTCNSLPEGPNLFYLLNSLDNFPALFTFLTFGYQSSPIPYSTFLLILMNQKTRKEVCTKM